MLTPGLFDIRFGEQFDLLSPLKLCGRPSLWGGVVGGGGTRGGGGREDNCPAIMMTISGGH